MEGVYQDHCGDGGGVRDAFDVLRAGRIELLSRRENDLRNY